jgi:hypothetical protein
MFVEVGNPTGIAMALEEMAMIETIQGRHERALLLAGAASAIKEEIGGGAPAELMGSDEFLARSRSSLDSETSDRAWNEERRWAPIRPSRWPSMAPTPRALNSRTLRGRAGRQDGIIGAWGSLHARTPPRSIPTDQFHRTPV